MTLFFEEALRNELVTIESLNSKVFPLNAIEGVSTPYIVYIASEGVNDETLDGFIVSKEIDCELHILSDKYGSMKDLTRQVIDKVKSFQGRVIGGDDGVKVLDITYEKSHEEYMSDLFQYLSIVTITVRI